MGVLIIILGLIVAALSLLLILYFTYWRKKEKRRQDQENQWLLSVNSNASNSNHSSYSNYQTSLFNNNNNNNNNNNISINGDNDMNDNHEKTFDTIPSSLFGNHKGGLALQDDWMYVYPFKTSKTVNLKKSSDNDSNKNSSNNSKDNNTSNNSDENVGEYRNHLTLNDMGDENARRKVVSSDKLKIDLDRILGSGSSGIVLLGKFNGHEVAVKRFPHIEDVKEFQTEATLLTQLNHPNIINILAICLAPPTLVIPYAPHGSLRDLIRNRKKSKIHERKRVNF